jgi:leucyl/phenylalanyl-tRNA--protein transferase
VRGAGDRRRGESDVSIPYLPVDDDRRFPPPESGDPEGLVAVGGTLTVRRLLVGYMNGIFPWYEEGQPVLWWSPDPRFVLFPARFRIPRSMRPLINRRAFRVSYDQRFREVMTACGSAVRPEGDGTWITDDMVTAYAALHARGFAHSVEVWDGAVLVGGLYGVALGRVFFGESMFTRVPNASKYGFITLVQQLRRAGFVMIDCQFHTAHLERFGAEHIPRAEFLRLLHDAAGDDRARGDWGRSMPVTVPSLPVSPLEDSADSV